MRIGVTGGAGFIGSNFVELLSNGKDEVVVFDNLQTGSFENLTGLNHSFIEGDLRDSKRTLSFVEENELDYIVHLAALGSVPRSIAEPRSSFETNTVGTFNLLEAARIRKVPIIFSSSSSVYGKNPKIPKEELDWLSPITPYAASKLSSESLCMAYRDSYNINVLVYRLFNVFGPRQNPEGIYSAVIAKWIIQAFRGETLQVFGDGEQKRDFTYVEDVTEAIYRSIQARHNPEFPVNLAFGNAITLNEILNYFKNYFGKLRVEHYPVRSGDIRNSEADPKVLSELHRGSLGITPIQRAFEKTFEWYKKKYKF